MKIYIVRHGETKSNEEGRLQGWRDDPLNELGVNLAVITGQAMKEIHFDAAFSSSLQRAKHTAEIILKESGNDIPIQIDDRIKEIHMGDYEGKRFKSSEPEIDPARIYKFLSEPDIYEEFPNGESISAVMKRSQNFLFELATKKYESVLVATHGCALRCMLNFLYDNPEVFWHNKVPYNCCINELDVEDGIIKFAKDEYVLYDQSFIFDRYDMDSMREKT